MLEDFILALLEQVPPCDECKLKNICEVECKKFKTWVNTPSIKYGEKKRDKPIGLTEREVLSMFPNLTKRSLKRKRDDGLVKYELWENKCIYTDVGGLQCA